MTFGVAPPAANPYEEPIPLRTTLGNVFRLGTPSVIENLLPSFIFLSDALMLAALPNNKYYLAATALTGTLLWRLTSTAACTMAGATAYIARRWGEERYAEAGRATTHAAVLGVIVGIVVAAASIPLASIAFRLLGAEPEVLGPCITYFQIILLSLPIRLAGINLAGAMRAAGDTRGPLVIAVVMVLMNIFLNWVLIFGNLGAPRLEMDGSAWASSASFAFGSVMAAWMLWRGRRPRRLMPRSTGAPIALTTDPELVGPGVTILPPQPDDGELRLSRAGARPWLEGVTPTILRVSWPALWEEILVSIGFLGYIRMVSSFGTDVLAAHTATVKLESFSYCAGWGVAVATTAMVGQALGARRVLLARRLFGLNTVVVMVIMGIMGAAMMLFQAPLLGLFHLDTRAHDIAVMIVFILGMQQVFIGSTMVLAGGLRGAGDTFPPFVMQLVGTVAVRIGVGWLLAWPLGMGIAGLYWATTLDWFIRTLVLVFFVLRGGWQRIRV